MHLGCRFRNYLQWSSGWCALCLRRQIWLIWALHRRCQYLITVMTPQIGQTLSSTLIFLLNSGPFHRNLDTWHLIRYNSICREFSLGKRWTWWWGDKNAIFHGYERCLSDTRLDAKAVQSHVAELELSTYFRAILGLLKHRRVLLPHLIGPVCGGRLILVWFLLSSSLDNQVVLNS